MARILLVEDDAEVGPLLAHILSCENYEVTAAASAGAGLKHINSEMFDLVITDLRLGDGSGLDLADAARAAGMRTLVLSGYLLQSPPERLAVHRFLWKPVRAPELLKIVDELLAEPQP